MEYMTEQQLIRWLQQHGGERGREPYYETAQTSGVDEFGDPTPPRAVRQQVGMEITARDGATIKLSRNEKASGQYGPEQPEYVVHGQMDAKPDETTKRTPEQIRNDTATATKNEYENTQEVRDNNERSWNQQNDPDHLPETHLEKAERKAKALQEDRAEKARLAAQRATAQAEENRTREAAADRAERARTADQSASMTQQQIDEQRRQNEYTRNKPEFLPGDSKNKFTTVYNPATQTMEALDNPNYDAVKAQAEERRAELASQVQSGQLQLEAAKQQYTQWFDTNVKTPLMLSQEARAKAEEKRQALEAEERRRQFAADFGLRKATLGQQAGQAAAQNEISLLPYRSGPTWGADISSAINSLGAGGNLANDASAGIHFSDSSFAFQRPDFKQIAKEAAKAALSGLTDYRPSDQQFETGDYSGVPAVNLGGAPAPYSFNAPLPAPSPEYTE